MGSDFAGVPVVSSPAVPDVFADEAVSFELVNGTVRISFSSVKMIEPAAPSPVQHVIIGRLILTIPGAQRLALSLFDYLEKSGMDPRGLLGDQAEQRAN